MVLSSIWDELPRPALILAPMEGVTDAIFRQVMARAGRPDLFFTEFTNVSSYASEKGRANALERLKVAPSDPPIIAQVWGKNPEHFAICVAALAGLGFSGVDLNFGCPDRQVIKAGGGANMIREPELAVECLRRAREATELAVSVKTRLGYSAVGEYREWLSTLLREKPAALTVHLRTKKEMSKVPAHFEVIADILALRGKISPGTKLVINGDIRDRAMALELFAKFPEVDGFMIGRGVFQNPFCFRRDEVCRPARAELLDLLFYHLELFEQESQKRHLSYEPLKHFFKIYINNFPGAGEIRGRLMQAHSVAEARQVLAEAFRDEA